MKITKEQWESIETELTGIFANVTFEYKGYEVTVARHKREGKSVLSVYINGHIKGKWFTFDSEGTGLSEDAPEILKEVWKLTTKAKYKTSMVTKLEKLYGKRRAKKEYPDLHDRYEYWFPFFNKTSVLVRQFKQLEGITLTRACCLDLAE